MSLIVLSSGAGNMVLEQPLATVQPAPHDVVAAPSFVEKGAEVVKRRPCELPSRLTGLALVVQFIDQATGVLGADADHLDRRRLPGTRVIAKREAHLVVFVETHVVPGEKAAQHHAFRRVQAGCVAGQVDGENGDVDLVPALFRDDQRVRRSQQCVDRRSRVG